jgi:hypothetical protein
LGDLKELFYGLSHIIQCICFIGGETILDTAHLQKSALFEHRFWLQILGDHGRFILSSLSPEETEEIERAQGFIDVFDSLLLEARQDIEDARLASLTHQAYQYAAELRIFKLHLLKRQLAGEIKIYLSPTFFNHMLNELEEYMKVLCQLLSGHVPDFHPVHYHVLWLSDAVGHAAGVASNLDEAERKYIEESKRYEKDFQNLYTKAQEITGYMRTGLYKFPALCCFNCQAENTMVHLKNFF